MIGYTNTPTFPFYCIRLWSAFISFNNKIIDNLRLAFLFDFEFTLFYDRRGRPWIYLSLWSVVICGVFLSLIWPILAPKIHLFNHSASTLCSLHVTSSWPLLSNVAIRCSPWWFIFLDAILYWHILWFIDLIVGSGLIIGKKINLMSVTW